MDDDAPSVPARANGYCPRVQWAAELIGSRWTGAILLVVLEGARRFSDIRDAIPGLSDRLLWERLRRLQAEGLVIRQGAAGPAAAAGYAPTAKAEELGPLLRELGAWATRWELKGQRADADPRAG